MVERLGFRAGDARGAKLTSSAKPGFLNARGLGFRVHNSGVGVGEAYASRLEPGTWFCIHFSYCSMQVLGVGKHVVRS